MAKKQAKKLEQPYITRVRLENVRGFGDTTLNFEFDGQPRRRTLVIGQNGTGKTSLLRSIALAVSGPPALLSLLNLPNGFYSREGHVATITMNLGDVERTVRIDRTTDSLFSLESAYFSSDGAIDNFIVAYGINRSRIGQSRGDLRGTGFVGIDSCLSLFDSETVLSSPELILRRLQDYLGESVYEKAILGIRRILNLPEEANIEVAKGGGIQITALNVGKNIPLEGWADGHRQTFQWILDFYGWAIRAEALTEDGGVRGILLIDEIEQHLHPSQQLTLMDRLRDLFPDLQIVATTHSPLVALGVEPHELIALKRQGDSVVAVENVPDYRTYSVEDLIKDDLLFDTPVYSPKTQEKLSQYESLAVKSPKSRSAKENKQMAQLAREMTPTALEDDPVLQEIRKLREELKK